MAFGFRPLNRQRSSSSQNDTLSSVLSLGPRRPLEHPFEIRTTVPSVRWNFDGGIVRIGSVRDASDIAFLTSDKQCQVIRQAIQVSET
jgi:hypothetical protein